MPRNGSGIYTLPGGNPVTPGDVIEAEWANTTLEDVADALTNSLSRTGAGGMLAPFRIADGSVSGPGLSYLNETNTGLYRSAAGSTWMSVLGVNTAQFSTVGLTIPFGKALTAAGNASVAGTFSVGGATTLGSTLAVTGAITATGGVSGNVAGNVTATTGTSTFNDVVVTGSLDMTAGSSATITGLSTPTNASDAANKGYVDTQDALRLALTGGTMSGAIAMGNSKITGLATPTADQDAATKAYVDTVAQGLDVKGSCRVGTTANITLSGTQTIDGVAVIAGDRVLVKNQSAAAENGIYVAAAGAWSRSTDADTWSELVGAFTFVEEGTVNDNSGWVCTSPQGGTLGVTAVTWEQFSGAGQITAGAGLFKSGNTLNVGTASSARIVVGTDDIDLATTGVTAATYKSVTVDAYGRVTAGTNPTTLAGFGITDAYTQAQVDSALALKLNLTGGTMSGVIAMGANKITGLSDPTNPQDAATKSYIDTIFGSTTTAAASAAAAASSASAASASASSASSSATAAAGSATSAASSYTTFNNQYLGSKSSDPSVNNTGGALVAGNLYWNSTALEMRVYNGSAWVAAYLPAAGYAQLAATNTFTANQIIQVTDNTNAALRVTQLGTAASILVEDSTNPDSSPFIVDASGNVGVGTSSPSYKLQVTTASAGAVSRMNYTGGSRGARIEFGLGETAGGVENYIDFSGTSGTSAGIFKASGTEVMRLNNDGNVGIGTSSPAQLLDVQSATSPTIRISNSKEWASGDSGVIAAYQFYTKDASTPNGTKIAAYINSENYAGSSVPEGILTFGTSAGGGSSTNATEKMRLDSAGSLLLGTTSSTGAKLTVVGDQHIRSGYGLAYYDSTNANYWAQYNGSGAFIFTNGTERARMTSTGGFCVGTTTDPGAGLISDASGNVRSIPPVGTKTGSYTLVKADVGKYVQVGSGGSITIPNSVFAEGDVVSIFNNTTGSITITCTIATAYKAGTDADQATVTLNTRGVATVLFISGTVCVISGNLA